MTREEAIEVLQGMLEGLAGGENISELKLTMEALDMAIRALKNEQTDGDLQKEIYFWHTKCTEYEQTIAKMAVELNDVKAISAEKTDGDLISRQATIDALWKALYEYEDKTEKQFIDSEELDIADWIQHRVFVQNMSDIDRQTILNMSPATPQPNVEKTDGDLISRTDLLELIKKIINPADINQYIVWCKMIEVVEKLSSVQPKAEQEPCGDCISRAEAIKTLKELEQEDIETYGCKIQEGFDADRAIEKLRNLPSAEKTAEWVAYTEECGWLYQCSNCCWSYEEETKFCPHCGCRMGVTE